MRSLMCFTMMLLATLISSRAGAQNADDAAYVHAVSIIRAAGAFGGLFREWCDMHAPDEAPAHAAALSAWRADVKLNEIDARAVAAKIGDIGNLNDARKKLFPKLDKNYADAAAACRDMAGNLRRDFDPRKSYTQEYQLALARPLNSPAPIANSATPNIASNRRVVAMPLDETWNMGYGGMMVLDYRPIVLFADGSYTTDAAHAIDGNVTRHGRWHVSNGNYVLTPSSGKTGKSISTNRVALPARRNQRLAGRYSGFSGIGGGATGTAAVVSTSSYDFAADGTVRISGSVGSSTPDDGNGSVVTRTRKDDIARYRLDGHTITFMYADGRVQQMLFYFLSRKEDVIALGARKLIRAK